MNNANLKARNFIISYTVLLPFYRVDSVEINIFVDDIQIDTNRFNRLLSITVEHTSDDLRSDAMKDAIVLCVIHIVYQNYTQRSI